MKRLFALILVVAFGAIVAVAQDAPKFEVFGGYQLLNLDNKGVADRTNMHGWNTDVAAGVAKHVSVVADFSGNYKTETATFGDVTAEGKFHVYNFLFGPRFSARTGKVTPFAEALFGLAHTKLSASVADVSGDVSSNNFGMAFGGGVDVAASKNVSIRVVKFDYLFNRVKMQDSTGSISDNLNNLRFSTGIVFKF